MKQITDLNNTLPAAGSFRSTLSVHNLTVRFLPFVVAVAMAGTPIQGAAIQSHPAAARQNRSQHNVPGQRLTGAQQQALAGYGNDVDVQFGGQDVPSSLRGRLSVRTHAGDPVAEAQAALSFHGAAFRRGQDDGFAFEALEPDKAGNTRVRMSQTYKDLRVIGGELAVNFDQNYVTGISGRFVPDLNVETTVPGNPDRAIASAHSFIRAKEYSNAKVAGSSAPVVYVDEENGARLAVPIQVTYDTAAESNEETLYVDAVTGSVLGTQSVNFVTLGCCAANNWLLNPGFEQGRNGNWTESPGGVIYDNNAGRTARSGSLYAWLNGWGHTNTEYLGQIVKVPSDATSVILSFWLHIDTNETTTTTAYDKLQVQIKSGCCGVPLVTLATFSNLDHNTGYVQKQFDVTRFRGQSIMVYFIGDEDSVYQTSFVIDDTALMITRPAGLGF